MEKGLPVIASDFAGSEFLPDSLVMKVQPGETESSEIKYILEKLFASSQNFSNTFSNTFPSKKVSNYSKTLYSADLIASELTFLIEKSLHPIQRMQKRWEELESNARQDVFAYLNSLNSTDSSIFDNQIGQFPHSVLEELGWA